jgi:hypothetical protein
VDFGTLLFLGLIWFLFNLFRQGASKPQSSGPRPLPTPPGVDATQREGSRLELLLRDLTRSMEEAANPRDTEVEEGEAEERETLEVVPEVITLERDVTRAARARVDHDDTAEQLVARRIAAAEARGGALTPADHRKFDKKIRQEPADHTAVRKYTPQQLRDAVVWREILGPPAGLS